MKHAKTPQSQDIQDVTDYFRIAEENEKAEIDKIFDGGSAQWWDELPITRYKDVPEPVISMVDIGHYSAIVLNGMGIFYIGTLIGNAIAYLLR